MMIKLPVTSDLSSEGLYTVGMITVAPLIFIRNPKASSCPYNWYDSPPILHNNDLSGCSRIRT